MLGPSKNLAVSAKFEWSATAMALALL